MKVVKITGQLEQEVKISKTTKKGFRFERGKLLKYTKDGRKRKNWMNYYRHISQKHLKDKCENQRCNLTISKKNYLTIHHEIALSTAKSEEELRKLCEKDNCKTLCKTCHSELEYRLTLERNGKAKKKKVKGKVKRNKKAPESILVLEETGWGGYRIIGTTQTL